MARSGPQAGAAVRHDRLLPGDPDRLARASWAANGGNRAKKAAYPGARMACFRPGSDRKNPLAIDSSFGHKVPTPALPDGMRV
jgi:hypothetical protein